MPIVVEHGPSLALAGSVSYDAGRKESLEKKRRQAQLEALRQAELQERQRQFNLNLQDRLDARTRDEQRFLLGNAFQQQRDQLLFQQNAARDERLFRQNMLRDNLGFERDVGLNLLRQSIVDDRDANLFAQQGAENAEMQIGKIEQQLSQAQFTPQGNSVRSELLGKLQSIRKQRSTLRPAQYLDLLNQWAGEYQSSGIQNHVQPPPDPIELFGGFVKNPETGAVDWKDGTQFFTHPGGFAIYNNQGKQEVRPLNHKDLVEAWGPELAAKIAKIPVDMLPKRETAQVRPFVDQSGRFDSDAFAKLRDRLRTETVQKEDGQGELVEVPKYGNEAELDRAAYLRAYAGIEPRFRPVAMLEGIMRGDLTPGDVQEMGFGDRLTDAVKQAVMSGQLDPVQAREMGFDILVGDQGVRVRIQPNLPKMPLLWDESGHGQDVSPQPAASAAGLSGGPQQSMTAGQRIQQNRVAAQPFVAEIREKLESGSLSDAAARAMNVMPQQAAPVIAELKQLTELYASRLESTGVGLEFTDPEKYQRMKELNMLLEKMANPESQLRPDRVPDVFLGGGP